MQDGLEGVENFRAGAQRVREPLHAQRHDHELLEVGRVLGVLAAVQDVEHRDRQDTRAGATQVAIERQLVGGGGSMCARQRRPENCVRAQGALVRRAVELQEHGVDTRLVGRVVAEQRGRDRLVHVCHGRQDALAAVARLVAIAQLDGLMGPGRGA